ncbi:MAG: phosphoribosylanthranilate isomerase [Oleiphilaceae bacterium]
MRVRAKICGITSFDDAYHALENGADALGFVFYKSSPRYISPDLAKEICQKLPPFVCKVGLFVNASREDINHVCNTVSLDLLQFHGDEREQDCLDFSIPYIKAIRIQSEKDVECAEKAFPAALAILVDTYVPGVPGGTGERFDWSLLPKKRSKPLILAGGLNEKNIYQAIQSVRPYAVDVSGGVEQEKGKKNHQTVTQFLNEVSRASE